MASRCFLGPCEDGRLHGSQSPGGKYLISHAGIQRGVDVWAPLDALAESIRVMKNQTAEFGRDPSALIFWGQSDAYPSAYPCGTHDTFCGRGSCHRLDSPNERYRRRGITVPAALSVKSALIRKTICRRPYSGSNDGNRWTRTDGTVDWIGSYGEKLFFNLRCSATILERDAGDEFADLFS